MAKSPRAQYDPKRDPENIRSLLSQAQDMENLNEWETEFVDNLTNKLEKNPLLPLTEAQYQKLTQIVEKEDEFEVW